MMFTETGLPGVYLIDVEKRSDDRGFFARAFCADEFVKHGLESSFVQANLSGNNKKFTLRGMHMQAGEHGEVKLVRCTHGAIFDVAVDLRKNSPTFGRWVGAELTRENRRMLYIPKGFAHGYQTLCDDTDVFYLVSAAYAPQSECGARWDDPLFAIDWPEKTSAILSDKDRNWPLQD